MNNNGASIKKNKNNYNNINNHSLGHHALTCSELEWVCVLIVAESYGTWGEEASTIISSIASRQTTST